MKVAFVSGNRDRLPDAVIPLGLLYVMAATADRHETLLVDLCFEDRPFEALARRIGEFDPDVVALGMRNIQNADYSGVGHSLDYYREVVARTRAVTDAPIVLGGSGFSVIPTELMHHLRPDYGISGEGERALPDLLDAIASGQGFERIGSLHRFRDGELVTTPPARAFLDMDRLPKPDRTHVDRRYYELFGIDSLQTKRGCPLHCEYCTYPIIEGRVGRARDPLRVVDEMEELLDQAPRPNHVFVVDSVFNLPNSHAKAVCREIARRRIDLPWTCYANPLGFDAELAQLMAAAGCAGMEVGADSGSDEVLKRLRKGFDTGQIRRFHELAVAAGLRDCHTFILGTAGEDLDDVKRTLDFVVDLDPDSVILMLWTDDAESLDVGLAERRRALREQILDLLRAHRDEFAWWSIPAIGVNYDPRLFQTLRRRGLHGPLWQHLRRLRAAPPAAHA